MKLSEIALMNSQKKSESWLLGLGFASILFMVGALTLNRVQNRDSDFIQLAPGLATLAVSLSIGSFVGGLCMLLIPGWFAKSKLKFVAIILVSMLSPSIYWLLSRGAI
jgi:hypothetical protein